MKKILFPLLMLLILLSFPVTIFAHGGVEKRAGSVLVTLFQTPLSPFVDENVNFSFILTDQSKNHVLKNKTARLVITKTVTGDAGKDQKIFTKTVISDVNGIITFSYSFPTTNYYDIDLEFGKPNDETNTTGFLVQPRENLLYPLQLIGITLVVSLLLNIVLLIRFNIKKNNRHT